MPYILKKTNGETLTTVADGSLYLGTDLVFVGKNYAGYGEILNQDLLKLLENFANATAPVSPLRGQLWYDSFSKKLKVYGASTFKTVARLEYAALTPAESSIGDLWWDTSINQLKMFTGAAYTVVSGANGAISTDAAGAIVGIVSATVIADDLELYSILKHVISDEVVAITSNAQITVNESDPLYSTFPKLYKGINLVSSDPITGSSTATSYYFWGTAADSARLGNSPASDYVRKDDPLPTSNTATFHVGTLIATTVTTTIIQAPTIGTFRGNWILDTGATLSASYADIAERYHADKQYVAGTVLVLGGANEVSECTIRADTAVAGIVSTKYAHLMNATVGNDETHPPIALAGRVPCLVVGPIIRGDRLVTSARAGYAEAWRPGDCPSAVIGKAMQTTNNMIDTIEVKV
jgi:hypothetical protein